MATSINTVKISDEQDLEYLISKCSHVNNLDIKASLSGVCHILQYLKLNIADDKIGEIRIEVIEDKNKHYNYNDFSGLAEFIVSLKFESRKITIKPHINNKFAYIFIFDQSDYKYLFKRSNASMLNSLYENKILNFYVCNFKKYFDPLLLHNFVAIYSKFSDYFKKYYLRIYSNNTEKSSEGNLFTIATYFAAFEQSTIFYNNKIVSFKTSKFGALPPIMYVNDNILRLLQKPLPIELWNNIQNNDDLDKIKLNQYKIILPYLKVCQRYLFKEFAGNLSKEYTELRMIAFRSKQFKKYVDSMPFLALLIFSMYDSFFRNDLLYNAKIYYEDTKLIKSDLLLQEQYKQEFKKYKKYIDNKETADIKNLISEYDKISKNVIIHSTVISEIFECISIAEGLLQILENAVLHAGGGSLSLRIYNRSKGIRNGKPKEAEHIEYLNDVYNESYFSFINSVNKTDYFLEVQVSDLSDKSIPLKFIDNYTSDIYLDGGGEIERKNREKVKKLIESAKNGLIDLKYFFNPEDKQLDVKREFFTLLSENLVFHYGLEIFTNILTSRKGIFAVCGYKDSYDNLNDVFQEYINEFVESIRELSKRFPNFNKHINYEDIKKIVRDKITQNADMNGTTYRVLLPLNHIAASSTNAVSNEIGAQIDFAEANKYETVVISREHILNGIKKADTVYDKRKNIKNVAKCIRDYISEKLKTNSKTDNTSYLLCINFNNVDNTYFEEIIKGIALFILDKNDEHKDEAKGANNSEYLVIPVAIINLTSFQLIEAARILAIYYGNSNITNLEFSRFQFYLKTKWHETEDSADKMINIPNYKELIFSGENLAKVKENLIKTAMSNGAMSSELAVLDQMLGGMIKRGIQNEED